MAAPPHDPNKRAQTLKRRNLDLIEMALLLDGRPAFSYASPQKGEARFVTVAEWHGKLCAVVWMYRDGAQRIITARRARQGEEQEFDRQGLHREKQPDIDWWERAKETPFPEPERDDGPEL